MQTQSLDEIALFLRRLQWTALGLGVCWLVWLLAPILSPFAFAADAGAGWAIRWSTGSQRAGRSRNTAVTLVFTMMALIVLAGLLILVPLIERQITTLIESLPQLSRLVHADRAALGRAPHRHRRSPTRSTWTTSSQLIRDNWDRAGGIATTMLGYLSRSGFGGAGHGGQHRAAAGDRVLLPARLGPAGRAGRIAGSAQPPADGRAGWRASPATCSARSCAASSW